jgi:hypothetical protein
MDPTEIYLNALEQIDKLSQITPTQGESGEYPISDTETITYKFGIGQIAYSRQKAEREGVLEAVSIASVNPITSTPESPGVTYVGVYENLFQYFDTFNRLWFEEDLVWLDEALELAIEYWEYIAEEALKLIN